MNKPQPTVDLGYPTPAHGRIPSFQNIEEEAEFWDTHSFTEFDEELVSIGVSEGRKLSDPLSVRLDQDDRVELNRRARDIGVGPSTLVRMWVKERLNQGASGE
jgi:hypothetical protein